MKENRWLKGLIVMGGAAWMYVMVKLSYYPEVLVDSLQQVHTHLLVTTHEIDSGRRLTVLPLYPRLCPPVLIRDPRRACTGCRYSARTPTVRILTRW
jgi:hypothetical protein